MVEYNVHLTGVTLLQTVTVSTFQPESCNLHIDPGLYCEKLTLIET